MGRSNPQYMPWKIVGIQVIPVDDLREHTLEDCWCEPHDDEGIVVHHAMDRRELYEDGDRKPS